MNTLLIDNYDSFTYNLFQLLAEVSGVAPRVIKNDELSWEAISKLKVDCIVLSPGPGHPREPRDFGVCHAALAQHDIPVLGICLGHQGLCMLAGGEVVLAPEPMHGRISTLTHNGDALFADIPRSFEVVRYHSFVAATPLPPTLEAIAHTHDGLVMGVRHRTKPQWGLQFHPESIASQYGHDVIRNFYRLARNWHRQPRYRVVVKTLPHDTTPDSVFLHAYANRTQFVWLDSNKDDDANSRYSILGGLDGPLSRWVRYNVNTQQTEIVHSDKVEHSPLPLFATLQQQLHHFATDTPELSCPFNLGYIGYFGYEIKADTVGHPNRHQAPYPDAQFLLVDRALVFDHQEQQVHLLALCPAESSQQADAWFATCEAWLQATPSTPPMQTTPPKLSGTFDRDKTQYLQDIDQCLTAIRQGESYELCLTNQWRVHAAVDPVAFYFQLRQRNPAPYAALLRFGELTIASASIERFIRVDRGGHVETKPIKGTLPRGRNAAEDALLKTQLASDEKFRAENLMIVDLLRNDLGKVCQIGSVHVPTLMAVESYATVHQLVSTVRGTLKPECNALDALRACFPGGSMTGAPKLRTLDILDSLETEARGVYSGCIGYLALNGSADFNIVIRTAVFTSNEVSIGVGGAIIALSDPQEEFAEIELKARALQQALVATV